MQAPHGEYRASRGVDYCNVLCFKHAIDLTLIPNEVDLKADSNDSSPTCKTKSYSSPSQHEHTITVVMKCILKNNVVSNSLRTSLVWLYSLQSKK